MPGFVVHIAVAQEYLKKHNKSFSEDFILGSIEPDFTNNKSETHYGKLPAYTNLKKLKEVINDSSKWNYYKNLI